MSLPHGQLKPMLATHRNDGLPTLVNSAVGEELTIRELSDAARRVMQLPGYPLQSGKEIR